MIPVSTPLIIFLRVFLACGVTYLAIVDTLKFIWMRRVVRTTSEHTDTLMAQGRKMKDLSKQIAYAIERLNPQPTPPAKLGPQLVEKKARAMARIAKGSENLLLEEEAAEGRPAK